MKHLLIILSIALIGCTKHNEDETAKTPLWIRGNIWSTCDLGCSKLKFTRNEYLTGTISDSEPKHNFFESLIGQPTVTRYKTRKTNKVFEISWHRANPQSEVFTRITYRKKSSEVMEEETYSYNNSPNASNPEQTYTRIFTR